MLFDASRHEPLLDAQWDMGQARAAMRTIVAEIEDALAPDGTWPWHPLDRGSDDEPRQKSLYLGAAGVLWALWYLQRAGAITLSIAPAEWIDRVHSAYRAAPDTGQVVPSYFLGEAGILLVQWRLTAASAAADRLHAAVAANVANPTLEALWGAPGTMLGAAHMFEATGDSRWQDLYLANVESLWRTWQPHPEAGCHLWTQDLYGRKEPLLGAAHGFAGNAYALLRGSAWLSDDRCDVLYDRCMRTLCATAQVEGDLVNWPPEFDAMRAGRTKMLLQWCHGAPGLVTSLAAIPAGRSDALDAMLLRAGQAIWRAGPLVKGPGLCHGTAGNGYAFLALHERTRDAMWLERARRFAMHAIAQSEHARRRYGQRRATLWTGDAGLAVYLWHCVQGAGGLPTLDVLA